MPSHQSRSRIPMLASSWCGCSLETAAKIVGYVTLLGYTASIIIGGLAFIYAAYENTRMHYIYHEEVHLILFMEVFYIFRAVISVFLLIGVYKKKPKYVKMWVPVQGALLVLSAVTVAIYIIFLMMGYTDHPMLIFETLTIGINVYFFLLVHSYYRGIIINVERNETV